VSTPDPISPRPYDTGYDQGADQGLDDVPVHSAAPAAPAPPPASPVMTAVPHRGVRMRTVVFGLLLGLVAVLVAVARLTSREIDGVAVAIGALIVAGVLMLFGSLTAVARERRGG
jgi:hypothetical protein